MTDERTVYDLLPTIHRIRDAERGGPLEALLAVVDDEWYRLVEDVDGLYDNWFIETCDEWVVPYIADLLGVSGLGATTEGGTSRRALVANTIAYRRRKGTAAVLEQVARDATGWPARVVEYFTLLGTTQHLDHVRLGNVRTPDLRDSAPLELVDTPFDRAAHTVDVRHIDVGRGRHGIRHVGLHLWRLAAYPVAGADAYPVDGSRRRWTFDPAGRDVPLVNRPRAETDLTHLATEVNVPGRLRRRALHDELIAVRGGAEPVYFDRDTPVLRVRTGDTPIEPDDLTCCDLTDWRPPPDGFTVAVDPVLGRLTLARAARRVRVDYAYGSAGDLGAGPYDRRATLAHALTLSGRPWPDRAAWAAGAGWQVGVGHDLDPVPGRVVRTVGEAVRLWNERPCRAGGRVGVIAVTDSATYDGDLRVVVSSGDRLLLVAASWPDREPGRFVAAGLRPHLSGAVEVTGAGEFLLDGFSVAGPVTAEPGDLTSLVVSGCTVLGDRGVDCADNPMLTVRLLRSVCGRVRLGRAAGLGMTDSIVHADGDRDALAVDAASAHVEVDACTVLGRTTARSLAASNAILRGLVDVERRQQGCVRFTFLPPGSRAPRRYRCQPPDGTPPGTVGPTFTSMRPVDPAFGQLAADCPSEISTGADDEGEMGAFGFLGQHRRLSDLRSQLDTYLRFGLEAGILLET